MKKAHSLTYLFCICSWTLLLKKFLIFVKTILKLPHAMFLCNQHFCNHLTKGQSRLVLFVPLCAKMLNPLHLVNKAMMMDHYRKSSFILTNYAILSRCTIIYTDPYTSTYWGSGQNQKVPPLSTKELVEIGVYHIRQDPGCGLSKDVSGEIQHIWVWNAGSQSLQGTHVCKSVQENLCWAQAGSPTVNVRKANKSG